MKCIYWSKKLSHLAIIATFLIINLGFEHVSFAAWKDISDYKIDINKLSKRYDIDSVKACLKEKGSNGFHSDLSNSKLVYSAIDVALNGAVIFSQQYNLQQHFLSDNIQLEKGTNYHDWNITFDSFQDNINKLDNYKSVSIPVFIISKKNSSRSEITISRESLNKKLSLLKTHEASREAFKHYKINLDDLDTQNFPIKLQSRGNAAEDYYLKSLQLLIDSSMSEKTLKQELLKFKKEKEQKKESYNGHWSAATLKKEEVVTNGEKNTKYVIYTNDPLGHPLSLKNDKKFLKILQECGIDPNNVEQRDFRTKVQLDGTSCAPLSIEMMKIFAESNSDKEIKQKLAELKKRGSSSIRAEHTKYAKALEKLLDTKEKKVKKSVRLKRETQKISDSDSVSKNKSQSAKSSKLSLNPDINTKQKEYVKQQKQAQRTAENVKHEVKALNLATNNIFKTIDNRLSANIVGVASGDNDSLSSGLWFKGFYGNSKYQEKEKRTLKGIVFGVDTELGGDLIVGANVNYLSIDDQSATDSDKNDQLTVYLGGAYFGYHISENILLNSSLSYGWYNSRNENAKISQDKGRILHAVFKGHYTLYKNQYMTLIPNSALTYNSLYLKKVSDKIVTTNSHSMQQLALGLGLKVRFNYELDQLKITPEISIGYDRLLSKNNTNLQISNLTNNTILVDKLADKDNIFKLGLSTNLLLDQIEFNVGFEHVKYTNYNANIYMAQMRFNF